MAKSLPSPRVIVADAPEVEQLDAKFVYNFFVNDERGNDSGVISTDKVNKKPSESFDAQYIDNADFNRFTPRYIKLNWKPIKEHKHIIPKGITIKDNLRKVQYEQDFLSTDFTSMTFQDTGVDKKMNFFVKRLIQNQRNNNNPDKQQPFIEESAMDAAKVAFETMTDVVESTLVCESIADMNAEGYIALEKGKEQLEQANLLKEMKTVKTFGHINSRFIWSIMKTGLEGNLNVFADEIISEKPKYEKIETEAKNSFRPDTITKEDYDIEIQEYVGSPRRITVDGYQPQKQIMGYIIDKYEKDTFGNTKKHDPIVIESPDITTTVDLKVKYGSTYYYTIRSVAYVESEVEEVDTHEFYLVSYLFSSKNSSVVIVECTESTAPPSPADFDIKWDGNKQELILYWNFPINPQRDIKKWQVFRRKSIYDPYELIHMYDFDDSIIKIPDENTEDPDEDLIEYLTTTKTFYSDLDFKRNKTTGEFPTYIYTICSVDAHGHTSNYTTQFQCSFDRMTNSLKKKLISKSGAPKPFPNFYLLTDTFVDVMSTSNKNKSVKIYFTPEYLEVVNNDNQNLGLLHTKKDSLYKINLINLDLQEQQNIEITLQDMRRTGEKPKNLLTPSRPKLGQRKLKPRNNSK